MFHLHALETLTNNINKTVSKKEYKLFCKKFVFYKLQGKSFAESFCEYFDMNSCFLKNLSDETAKDHIEKLGYIK